MTKRDNSSLAMVLRDPFWQSIGVIVAIVGICLGLFSAYDIFFRGREIKTLDVNMLANSSLITVNKDLTKDIQILYKNEPVSNMTLIDISIKNSGNQTILPEDYIKPITFTFPVNSKVLETTILNSNPSNIDLIIQIDTSNSNIVHLSPILLNKSDEFIIRLLIINMPPSGLFLPFELDTRIAGIEEVDVKNTSGATTIQKLKSSYTITLSLTVEIFLLLIAFIIGMFTVMKMMRHPRYPY